MALKIKSYLDINYRNKISLEDISHTFYLSTKQLNRIFQKKYHITIVSYLKELRYHSALACLKTGGFSLREAAVQCGFSGYQQLHRMLKTREADPHKPVS